MTVTASRVRYLTSLTLVAFGLATEASSGSRLAQALTFNFSAEPGTPTEVISGFTAAGNLWSSKFVDDVTVNVDIGTSSLATGTTGSTSAMYYAEPYDSIRTNLQNQVTSTDDSTAFSNLQAGPTFNLLTNYSANNPAGSGSTTPYFDNNGSTNNTLIDLTTANAKAVGLLSNYSGSDGLIRLNSQTRWDYQPGDGITTDAVDLTGTATHELGHILGFTSGVDLLESSSGSVSEDTYHASMMDLFRFSNRSVALGKGIIDLTAQCSASTGCDQYFSIDGGVTKIANFSTGSKGDGYQASHLQEQLASLGIMDPRSNYGEQQRILENDLRLFDVIGWNRVDTLTASMTSATVPPATTLTASAQEVASVPEPATSLGLLLMGAFGLILGKRKLQ